ncbi:hypothetical protein DRH29_02275 [candidate division Kazan bacterium]|uniref:GerMN domain-containing protein n=1 Tax=candidate division Kazan bacterium TaxID=2202143 RepID=A0A420ZD15_UNCK3|nr:MAG: hypothetical protein DRH29_02275 [candidate division Kazan bacterium]
MKYIIWIIVLGVMALVAYQYVNNSDSFNQPTNTQEVLVFFNENKPTEVVQVGVKRKVEASDDEAKLALRAVEKLLEGPTASEEKRGLLTAIPEGTVVHSVNVQNGVATVDFNEAFDFQVGGATLVTAIREQVEQTLRQFRSISFVKMTINGQREAVLEP